MTLTSSTSHLDLLLEVYQGLELALLTAIQQLVNPLGKCTCVRVENIEKDNSMVTP